MLLYTTLHHTRAHYITHPYSTLHYTHYTTFTVVIIFPRGRFITLHSCTLHYTTPNTLHHNYNSTTLQLQLQLHCTTLHPAVVGEVTDQVTTATIATIPKNTTPTTFGSIRDSQQPTSPIGFLFWNFRHLVRYYWYIAVCVIEWG